MVIDDGSIKVRRAFKATPINLSWWNHFYGYVKNNHTDKSWSTKWDRTQPFFLFSHRKSERITGWTTKSYSAVGEGLQSKLLPYLCPHRSNSEFTDTFSCLIEHCLMILMILLRKREYLSVNGYRTRCIVKRSNNYSLSAHFICLNRKESAGQLRAFSYKQYQYFPLFPSNTWRCLILALPVFHIVIKCGNGWLANAGEHYNDLKLRRKSHDNEKIFLKVKIWSLLIG